MRVLWLIELRSRLQAFPGMYGLSVGDRPLAAWLMAVARHLPGEVWLCTDEREGWSEKTGGAEDDGEKAGEGEKTGWAADVVLPCPAELSAPVIPSERICLYAMECARQQGRKFDAIALLSPASPFIGPASLARAIAALEADPNAHGAVAVRQAHPGSAWIQADAPYLADLAIRLGHRKSAQPEKAEITPSGAFFVARWERFLVRHTFYAETSIPIRVENEEALNIRTRMEWEFAAFLASSGRMRPGEDPGGCAPYIPAQRRI